MNRTCVSVRSTRPRSLRRAALRSSIEAVAGRVSRTMSKRDRAYTDGPLSRPRPVRPGSRQPAAYVATTQPGTQLFDCEDFEVAFSLDDVDPDVVRVTLEREIDSGVA